MFYIKLTILALTIVIKCHHFLISAFFPHPFFLLIFFFCLLLSLGVLRQDSLSQLSLVLFSCHVKLERIGVRMNSLLIPVLCNY